MPATCNAGGTKEKREAKKIPSPGFGRGDARCTHPRERKATNARARHTGCPLQEGKARSEKKSQVQHLAMAVPKTVPVAPPSGQVPILTRPRRNPQYLTRHLAGRCCPPPGGAVCTTAVRQRVPPIGGPTPMGSAQGRHLGSGAPRAGVRSRPRYWPAHGCP